jgi:predicted metal-dependent hydrolase
MDMNACQAIACDVNAQGQGSSWQRTSTLWRSTVILCKATGRYTGQHGENDQEKSADRLNRGAFTRHVRCPRRPDNVAYKNNKTKFIEIGFYFVL